MTDQILSAVAPQASGSIRPPTVRAVWTDFGGVLTPAMRQTWGAFCATLRVDPDVLMGAVQRVTASYGTQDMMEPLDTPIVAESEWLRQIGDILRAEHGWTGKDLTTLGEVWFDDRETNHDWARALRAVRASGLFVGVLSNMVPTWDPYWRRLLPIDEMFEDVVLSFEVGSRKPQPEIFALAAERCGVPPEQCLLVDDLERNCEGAVAAGWQAIQFHDTAQTLAELAPLLADPSVLKERAVS